MLGFRINMGKRFLLTIISLLIFAGTSFGYSNPRWFRQPISVYVPKVTGNTTVSNAFLSWQTESAGIVRFTFKSNQRAASLADITVTFTNKASKPYVIEKKSTVFNANKEDLKNEYFYKLNIIISKADAKGKVYSSSELYAIALRAVGEALGVNAVGDKGVMSNSFNTANKKLTSDDIKLLKKVYRK